MRTLTICTAVLVLAFDPSARGGESGQGSQNARPGWGSTKGSRAAPRPTDRGKANKTGRNTSGSRPRPPAPRATANRATPPTPLTYLSVWDWLISDEEPVPTAARGQSVPTAARGTLVAQTRRNLRVKNGTAMPLRVYVRYRTLNDRGEWQWYPASEGAVVQELAPGQEIDLRHDGWRIEASRVRIWARAPGGTYGEETYRNLDLWLVSRDGQGSRRYQAAVMETYTHTFTHAYALRQYAAGQKSQRSHGKAKLTIPRVTAPSSRIPKNAGPNVAQASMKTPGGTPAADLVTHDRRYLRVRNATGEALDVYVRYYTLNDQGKWQWYPDEPASAAAVVLKVTAGKTVDVLHEDWRVNASRVRIWAEAPGGEYRQEAYRYQDLWLVSPDGQGKRQYRAAAMEAYTHTFAAPASAGGAR